MQANLDIQYTVGLTWPTPNVYYRYVELTRVGFSLGDLFI